jgi:hypothetical protein
VLHEFVSVLNVGACDLTASRALTCVGCQHADREMSQGGLVCYHGGPAGTDYAELGDCEVVQVKLASSRASSCRL